MYLCLFRCPLINQERGEGAAGHSLMQVLQLLMALRSSNAAPVGTDADGAGPEPRTANVLRPRWSK